MINIRGDLCEEMIFQVIRFSIFLDIFIDFCIFLTNFGHSLGTVSISPYVEYEQNSLLDFNCQAGTSKIDLSVFCVIYSLWGSGQFEIGYN